jgi:AbrB family looped-hinge helix DNA binding protein
MRTTQRIRQRGRLTVPQPIREELDLDAGDVVEVEVRPIE